MEKNQLSPEYFSISEGGPIYMALSKIRLEQKHWKLVLVLLCITWLPLVIITAIEGTLYSEAQMPFLEDVAMQVRLLVALPMLILIRIPIDKKLSIVLKYLSGTLVAVEDREKILPKVMRRAMKWTNSVLAELIMVAVVIALSISPIKGGILSGEGRDASLWMVAVNESNNALSFAGNWAVFISIPLFQFALLRWFWRYIVWVIVLFLISRMRLKLQPTHPDYAGGLGIIVLAQRYFILFFMAVSTVISGELITQLLSNPDSFGSIRNEAVGYILLCLFLILFPIVFFTGKLLKTKHDGLLKLSNLGVSLSNKFEQEWINDASIEKKLAEATASTSTVQDYSTIFKSLDELRPFPVTVKDVFTMTFLLLLPYIPILLIHFSIGELLQKLIGTLV